MKNFKQTLNYKEWIKSGLILLILFAIGWFLPSRIGSAVEPWNTFSLKKIVYMVFSLAFIQSIGSVSISFVGVHLGSILTGFLGGLISSTATTAALAKKSKLNSNSTLDGLTFLSATLAMLCEGILLLSVGIDNFHASLVFLFFGPIIASIAMIYFLSRKSAKLNIQQENNELDYIAIVKLAIFIVGILTISNSLQKFFGQSGLIILTFFVSLFEIHGSLIANIQLHDSGAFDVLSLGNLLCVSIFSSYVSKIFIISTLGSAELRTEVLKISSILLASLLISWLIFYFRFSL